MVVWEQVDVSKLRIGDEVRVMRGAYRSYEVGRVHNGRLCEVINISGGDVVVKSIDDIAPRLTNTVHPPQYLEKKRVIL